MYGAIRVGGEIVSSLYLALSRSAYLDGQAEDLDRSHIIESTACDIVLSYRNIDSPLKDQSDLPRVSDAATGGITCFQPEAEILDSGENVPGTGVSRMDGLKSLSSDFSTSTSLNCFFK